MSDITVRALAPGDERAVVDLLAASLGWLPDDHHLRFFGWKHQDNPFGPSAAWVAEAGGRVVGFRTFLLWEFLAGGSGVVRAVRAVDTATHPEFRGAGIFRRLTLHGVEALTEEGVAFVFNTPNDQSRPGYLKMGWRELGRPPVAARPRTPLAFVRMAGARRPADLWSRSSRAGVPAAEALEGPEGDRIERLLQASTPASGPVTHRTLAYLRWRYAGFAPLNYRVLADERGAAFFRLRGRGRATEAVVDDVIAADGGVTGVAGLVRDLVQASGADYGLRLGTPVVRAGEVPIPGAGPVVTFRPLRQATCPPLTEWDLSMGDIELF